MNDPPTLKRPKPGDGEEELFRMQEEFLQSREQPSAKVINLRTQKTSVPSEKSSGKFRSKFAERRAMREQKLPTSHSSGSVINPEFIEENRKIVENLVDAVQDLPADPPAVILGNIVEKKFAGSFRESVESADSSGFPGVFIVNQEKEAANESSLFRQNLKRIKSVENSLKSSSQPESTSEASSVMVQGSLASEIHKQNVEKLRKMSPQEILEAKAQLESTLSPDLIKFIKSRRNASIKSQLSEKTLEMDVDVDAPTVPDVPAPDTPAPVSEIAEKAAESGWVHMDSVEPPKLEWMKDLQSQDSPDNSSEEPYNARFNFEGVLLPFRDDSIPMDTGLHHHGEEPERPGYSLQELLQLSRSATQQQRCTALTTLANIMEKSRRGWYDQVLDPAPLSALNSRNILLLLRFSLDDSSSAVVTATLQALRAFLCSEADEVCLDRLTGWRHEEGSAVPVLSSPRNDVNDPDNLKDHELAQLDSIAAAIRSDIVIRIRYILSEVQPPPVGVTAALEILIRLARHGRTTALNIACTPALLEMIVRNFVPLTTERLMHLEDLKNAYGVPNITALRLCRILIEYAGRPVAERLWNLRIVNNLLSYSTSEPGEAGLRLSIEALRLWDALCAKGVGLESVGGARLMLGSQLQLLLSNHDLETASELSCEHAAALVAISSREETLSPTIAVLMTKWSTQLSSLDTPTWCNTKLVAVGLISLKNMSSFSTKCFRNEKLFENLCSSSNLLSDRTTDVSRDPSSLPSLRVLLQDGELQAIVSPKSCFLFLSSLVNVFLEHSASGEFKTVLESPSVIKYLRRLATSEWSLESSWYTRPELFLLIGIVKIASKMELKDFTKQVVFRIAIKLVSSLPSDTPEATKDVLRVVLSNERINTAKLSNELNSLRLGDGEANRVQLPLNASEIYEAFICPGSWEHAAMPKDWPYLPLVAAYSDRKNQVKWNETDTIKIVLILSLEVTMPELVEALPPSLRFSRLILIYLCDTVYLNEDVGALLEKVVTEFLMRYHERLDLTKDIPGVSSFTDLFTALCECFCANSYGNDGFSMVLLVPIAQRHDVHFRKMLWSEHAGALRYLRISIDKLPVPLEEFLDPPEEDVSLIESYLTALVRGAVKEEWSPLMYKIAVHHSAVYLRKTTKLARKMREKIRGIRDGKLVERLLEYEGLQ